MNTDDARRRELFSDSEATLRQVEGVLSDLDGDAASQSARIDRVVSGLERRPAGLRDLVEILMATYSEIMRVIDSLRESRGLLEQAAVERLKSTHKKLEEVSSATELAATGMLDGLDRALELVNHLEPDAGGDAPRDASASEEDGPLWTELREELHTLVNLLQFQDITAQQLGYAGTVLMDIEDRMTELARVFDLRGMGIEEADDGDRREERPSRAEPSHAACDPQASHFGADDRQALADEIFR